MCGGRGTGLAWLGCRAGAVSPEGKLWGLCVGMRVRVCSEQGHEGRRWWLEEKSERGGQLGLRLSCSSARAPGPSRVSARQTQGESRLAAVYQQPPLALTLTPQRTPPDLQVAEPSRIFDGIGAHLCLSPDAGPQTKNTGTTVASHSTPKSLVPLSPSGQLVDPGPCQCRYLWMRFCYQSLDVSI